MPAQKFLIAPLNHGQDNYSRPWLIPDDAFESMRNAYIFRGRIRKRFGARLLNGSINANIAQFNSRLRINIGTTAAVTGNFAGNAPGARFFAGQAFSIGSTMFTVISNVAGAQPMLSTGTATGTFDVATGAVVITGNNENPLTDVFFYPSDPVMGFASYEQAPINNEPVFAFDRQFAFQFTGGAWNILGPIPPAAGSALWTGTDFQLFWTENFRGVSSFQTFLFVSNFNPVDQIKYWNGTIWTTINPATGIGADTIETARVIKQFKNRLCLFNTQENTGGTLRRYRNRVRFSQIGDPTTVDAFHEASATPGRGGFLDAPTQEEIISAEFIKDRLIVYFERSTWELVYLGNDFEPFRWQKINTELGAESTFSIVPFDKVVLGIGDVGIHACTGANVERIDEKIPDFVFTQRNDQEGIERIYGIRDYFSEMVYWSYPSTNLVQFTDKVLVYNYRTGSWAFNDDTITAFGYFQRDDDLRWNSTNFTWDELVQTWGSGVNVAQSRFVVAGNQEGYTFLIDVDSSRNAPAIQITNVTAGPPTQLTMINHNLKVGEYILIEHAIFTGGSGLNDQIFQVLSVIDADNVTIGPSAPFTGTYAGAGVATRVSQVELLTKQYNFFVGEDRNVNIDKIDFHIDKVATGEVAVDIMPSASNFVTETHILPLTAYTDPFFGFEQQQMRLWHKMYLDAEGSFIQLRIYFNAEQMVDPNLSLSDFQLHAMLFHANASAYRLT